MVIGSIVKYHIWLILSWSEVGSLINENDRLYGLSLIWSILVGQNSGPDIRYALYSTGFCRIGDTVSAIQYRPIHKILTNMIYDWDLQSPSKGSA